MRIHHSVHCVSIFVQGMQRRQGPQLDQRGMSTSDRVKQGGENGARLLDGESRLAQATVDGQTSLCEAVGTGVWPNVCSSVGASLFSQSLMIHCGGSHGGQNPD